MEHLLPVWDFLTQWYWIPLGLLYASLISTILIENRNPEKTIAWIMVIVFLPVIGIVLYYFFGQKFKKDRFFSRLDHHFAERIRKKWQELQPEIEQELQQIHRQSERMVDVFEYLNHTQNAIPTSNNHIQLLINGEAKFPLFLEDIAQAKHHIHLEYYIFDEDELGVQILDALVKKAKEGVEIRIIIDDFGSSRLAKRKKHYEMLGLHFELFFPVRFSSLANSNYRNHRKIMIVDGIIGYAGGINLSKKYDNRFTNRQYWRDTSVRITGDAVKMLQIQFWLHWQLTAEQTFELQSSYFPVLSHSLQHTPVTFAFSSPGNTIPYVMEAMITSIMSAQKSIILYTPYFIPTNEFKTALLIAVSKGVEVSLVLPQKGDSTIVQYASLSFLKPFIERGIKVYLYQKGFLHAKTISIDEELTYVGTTNLDTRSFLINFEFSAVILDKETARQYYAQFETDKKDCFLFTKEIWNNEKWYVKGFASICRLMAPLL